MRILQVVNVGFEAGGAEKSVHLITRHLRAQGHQVSVLATDRLLDRHPGAEVFADRLIPAIEGGALRRVRHYRWYPAAYRAAATAVRELDPDVVHLHTIGEFSPSVLHATRGVPRVLTVHGPEDWTRGLLRWNLRSAATRRTLTLPDQLRHLHLRWVQRPAYLPEIRDLDLVLTPSAFMAEVVRPDVGRVPVEVVPHGLDLPAAAPPTSVDRVVFVGRLEAVKGVQVLLAALARLLPARPTATLRVVGDGSFRPALEALSARLGLADRVQFYGHLDGAGVERHLRAAAVVAVPSVWPETSSIAAREALAVGRPLVASDTGGLAEAVEPGVNGLLVPPGDAAALATALTSLLGDGPRLQAMGRASRERAPAHAVQPFVQRLQEIYAEVAGCRARVGAVR